MNRRCAKGAAIGTVTGAALGAATGSFSGNAGRGALIGAVALAGGMMGAHMENQRKDFEKVLAPEISAGVIRDEKFPNDQLLVGMTGETSFEVDSDQIKPGFNSTMDKISGIVNKYGKTHLNVARYTDSTGSAAHNQALSERRSAICWATVSCSSVSMPRGMVRVGPLPATTSMRAAASTAVWTSPHPHHRRVRDRASSAECGRSLPAARPCLSVAATFG